MKNILILFGLLFALTTTAQEINFNVHKTSLKEYLALEKKLKSEPVPNKAHYISTSGEAQPLKFRRKEEVKILPDPVVSYFFKKKDSSITYILYEWDVYNYEKKDNNQKSIKFEKALIRKYQTLKERISELFGNPRIERNYSNIAKLDPENTFEEMSEWKPNDSLEITLSITSSNYYEKRGAVTINPVHRIRLYIKNLSAQEKKPKIQAADEHKIEKLNLKVKNFLSVLRKKDINGIKSYLSEKIVHQINDKVVAELVKNIDFDRELELIYQGIQFDREGNVYTLLAYKYKDDKENPPVMMMKIIFDAQDKIIGFQPLKRRL